MCSLGAQLPSFSLWGAHIYRKVIHLAHSRVQVGSETTRCQIPSSWPILCISSGMLYRRRQRLALALPCSPRALFLNLTYTTTRQSWCCFPDSAECQEQGTPDPRPGRALIPGPVTGSHECMNQGRAVAGTVTMAHVTCKSHVSDSPELCSGELVKQPLGNLGREFLWLVME